ncbi:MAG: Asp23/Gls24 family envelope stress response protein [Oscillospiraceae bacterium]|jgi:uncharacterized alkaline shock family protein YloU|nr:Asp23/Gls24 family envelope stress response protein [Oscillospiraceae bacterium]
MSDTKYVTRAGNDGTVSISEEVIATIAQEALSRVDGAKPVGSTKKNIRGVKVKVVGEKVTIDAHIQVTYGQSVIDSAKLAQKEIAESVSSMTGLEIEAVNITVNGIAPNVSTAQ